MTALIIIGTYLVGIAAALAIFELRRKKATDDLDHLFTGWLAILWPALVSIILLLLLWHTLGYPARKIREYKGRRL